MADTLDDVCCDCLCGKAMHVLGGMLGACERIGCACAGYLEHVHGHIEPTDPDGETELVVTIRRRHKTHKGWEEDTESGEDDAEEEQ